MKPGKSRSKTKVFIAVLLLLLAGIAVYYVTAIRNSDNRPESVETPSVLIK